MKRYLGYVALTVALSASCGVGTEAGDARSRATDFAPKCASYDGRCQVCKWSEGGESRCMVSIFSGSCPATATYDAACPPGPAVACDGSTAGYFAAVQSGGGLPNGYADAIFYYAKDVTGEKKKACLAMRPLIADYQWIEY